MKKLYFITGSQDLYGEEALLQVEKNSRKIAGFLDGKIGNIAAVEYLGTGIDSDRIKELCLKATSDAACVGVILWMHTFSPAKMWIKGLQILNKPILHLHTQANEKLPYDEIDMDFMNLNQSAHGDREFGFICTRLGIAREVLAGHYESDRVVKGIGRFAEVAKAVDFSKNLKVAMLGSNMREVAVTDGDRVESQIKYGWEVNYHPVGDLVAYFDHINDAQIDEKMNDYRKVYDFSFDNEEAVRHQARIELALEAFLEDTGAMAYTDTFQDLHGLEQLPGLATQRMQERGIGFGAEGDYKTAALNAVFFKMAENRGGATGFMEDYTYDLTPGQELVLGAHMLEVSPVFAKNKPALEVHPLSIGGGDDPARLVFDGVTGDAVAVCMVDMGDRFRLICARIELVEQPKPMPKLPVARLMWRLYPDFEVGTRAWIEAGGGHHTVVSNALTVEDIKLFAKLTDTELIVIDENTR